MTTDFIHGRPMKQIVLFSLPIMLSSLLQYTYNMVDNIIVGRYVSTNALAAVGNIAPINSFAIGAAFGLTAGFTIPVAQCFGAGDQEETNRQAGNGIGLSLITGVLFSALALLVLHPMLGWIHTPKEIYDLSVQYAAIMYLGVPAQLLYNVFTGIARSVGDSKKPLLFLLISVAVNLVLDLLFVAHFGWGVAGAAWATLISQIVAAVSAGIYVFRGIPVLQLKARMLVPTAKRTRRQLALGIPVSLQFTITSIGSMILQSAVNGFGANVVAAFTAAGRAESITNIPMSNLAVAASTFVAQNYGAGQYRRILTTVRKVFVVDLGLSVLCSLVLFFGGEQIVGLFMTDYNSQIVYAAKEYLFAISLCYSLVSVLFVLRNTLQGLGCTYANAVAGAGELIGRIAVSYLFTPLFGFKAVCFAGPVAWLLADLPLIVLYWRNAKQMRKLSNQ